MNLDQAIKVGYIVHMPGHTNSKGEPAPWVIKSHKNNKILSSHKTKEEAKKHLKNMHIFGSLLSENDDLEFSYNTIEELIEANNRVKTSGTRFDEIKDALNELVEYFQEEAAINPTSLDPNDILDRIKVTAKWSARFTFSEEGWYSIHKIVEMAEVLTKIANTALDLLQDKLRSKATSNGEGEKIA